MDTVHCPNCGWHGKMTDCLVGREDAGNLRWLCCPKCSQTAEGYDNLPMLYPKELREAK